MKEQKVQIPLTNQEFLKAVSNSFHEFVDSGTSRSTAKLKPLHGAIARDIAAKLGHGYSVMAQGYGDDREAYIKGRYMNKKVDITILKGKEKVAGIAVKFVMQNYAQNSNWKNRARETLYSGCLLTLLDTKKRATKVAIKLTPARAILTGDFFS